MSTHVTAQTSSGITRRVVLFACVMAWLPGTSEGAENLRPIQPLTKAFDLGLTFHDRAKRLVVAAVHPSSAGAAAKFEPGDTLLTVGGDTLVTPAAFLKKVKQYEPGVRLRVDVLRGDTRLIRYLMIPLILSEHETEHPRHNFATRGGRPYSGIRVVDHPNGQRAYETEYEEGVPQVQRAWDASGTYLGELICRDGHAFEGQEFKMDGTGGMYLFAVWKDGAKVSQFPHHEDPVIPENQEAPEEPLQLQPLQK